MSPSRADHGEEPASRSSKKDSRRRSKHKHGADSFEAADSWDSQREHDRETKTAELLAQQEAKASSRSTTKSTRTSLGNFLQNTTFDASRAKSVEMDADDDDDDEVSRGAYSTVSKMVKAKKRRKKILSPSLDPKPARGRASAPRPTALDLLDAFLAKNKLASLGDDADAEERSRGARSTMTGVVRRSDHRSVTGDGHQAGRTEESNQISKSKDKGDLNNDTRRHSINESKSRSRSQSRLQSSSRRSSPSRRQRSLTSESMKRSGSQSDLMNSSSSSLRDSMRKSTSLRDTMNKSHSSLRDSMRKSSSLRDAMNKSNSSLRDPMRKSSSRKTSSSKTEQNSSSSLVMDEDRHASRKSRSSVSGGLSTRDSRAEYRDHHDGASSRRSSSRRHKDRSSPLETESGKSHRKSSISAAETGSSSRRKSAFENGKSDIDRHSRRSSEKASAGKTAGVEKELLGLLTSLSKPSKRGDDKPTSDDVPSDVITADTRDKRDRRSHRASSDRKSIGSQTRQSSSAKVHESETEKSPRRIKSILKEPKYRDKSPTRHEGSKRRSSNKHDNAHDVVLDDFGLLKSPTRRRHSMKEGREKSPTRATDSLRRSTKGERSSLRPESGRASESSRRRSSKYTDAEESRSLRRRSPSRSRQSSANESKDKRSSRRSSTDTGGDAIDSDRKPHRRMSARSDREERRDSGKRRGRESRRSDEMLHSSSKRKSKTSQRSMSVQSRSHGSRRHRRPHSVGPTDRVSGDTQDMVANAKDHFRSLMRSGSEEEKAKLLVDAVIPTKILSIKGRFSGDEDDTLPRMEDRTPVSPGTSAANSVADEHQLDASDGESSQLPYSSDNQMELRKEVENHDSIIDLTDRVASPVNHIDLTDGIINVTDDVIDEDRVGRSVIDLNDHVDLRGQPISEEALPDRGMNDSIESERSMNKDAGSKPRRGLWGMIRSRIKSTDPLEDEKAVEALPDGSATDGEEDGSLAERDKDERKHGPATHLEVDGIPDDMTAAMSLSQHSANEKSSSGRDRSLSPIHYESSVGSVGSIDSPKALPMSPSAGLSRSSCGSVESGSEGSTRRPTGSLRADQLGDGSVSSSIGEGSKQRGRDELTSATSLTLVNGERGGLASSSFGRLRGSEIDALAPPSFVHACSLVYDEEDVFSVFCWSSQHRDEMKTQSDRKFLRESTQKTALYRAFERIK